MCGPPPPSVLMARFMSGHLTESSMPSMARLGKSYGNLKREVVWAPPPPSVLMARFTLGQRTTSSMPSMARVGSSYGNLKREVVWAPPPSLDQMARFTSGQSDYKLYAINGKSGVKLWEFETGGRVCRSSPAIGSDGTVYVGSLGQQALCHQSQEWGPSYGNLKRVLLLMWNPPPPLAQMAPFTYGSYDNKLYAIKMDSKRRGQKPMAHAWTECAAYRFGCSPPPPIGSDGNTVSTSVCYYSNNEERGMPSYGKSPGGCKLCTHF